MPKSVSRSRRRSSLPATSSRLARGLTAYWNLQGFLAGGRASWCNAGTIAANICAGASPFAGTCVCDDTDFMCQIAAGIPMSERDFVDWKARQQVGVCASYATNWRRARWARSSTHSRTTRAARRLPRERGGLLHRRCLRIHGRCGRRSGERLGPHLQLGDRRRRQQHVHLPHLELLRRRGGGDGGSARESVVQRPRCELDARLLLAHREPRLSRRLLLSEYDRRSLRDPRRLPPLQGAQRRWRWCQRHRRALPRAPLEALDVRPRRGRRGGRGTNLRDGLGDPSGSAAQRRRLGLPLLRGRPNRRASGRARYQLQHDRGRGGALRQRRWLEHHLPQRRDEQPPPSRSTVTAESGATCSAAPRRSR